MTSISYFPIVEDEDQLVDLISRAAWFLSFCPVDRIHIPIASDSLVQVIWRVARGMDPLIANNFDLLKQKVSFVVVNNETDLAPYIKEATIVLHWKKESIPSFISPDVLMEWERGKKVLQVDPVAVRLEGSYYIEVGLHLLKDKQALILENQRKFEQMEKRLGRFENAYILATGPSVSQYKQFNYANAFTVVCNSVILDEQLMEHVRPQVLVFADPIFHFGPSQYAAAFRARLRESARRHDFTICIPFKYYALFIAAVPELRERTIAIPYTKNREFNFDLASDYMLKSTANILTFLLVPIACTFSKKVGILGCDGRPLNENTYFWNHNPNTQINDKMANIREVHPGFFDIDYNDYYIEHCDTLEQQLRAGEQVGLTILSLGFSYIPALISRFEPSQMALSSIQFSRIISINPDAESFFGHFLNYEMRLGKVITQHGMTHFIAGPVDAEAEVYAVHPEMAKVFSVRTNKLYAKKAGDIVPDMDTFAAELDRYLATLDMDGSTLLFMYCGSIEIAEVLHDLAEKYTTCTFAISLYYLSWQNMKSLDFVRHWRKRLLHLAAHPRLRIIVPSPELAEALMSSFSVCAEILPHPSTTFHDADIEALGAGLNPSDRRPLTVVFPGNLRGGKGYDLTSIAIHELLQTKGDAFRIRLRFPPQDSVNKARLNFFDSVGDQVEIIDSYLDEQEFRHLLLSADLMVLPYTADRFGNRTSGLLVDSLMLGIPCIVIENTWLARTVSEYGFGYVSAEDGLSLASKVLEGLRNITQLKQNAAEGRKRYFATNSWRGLLQFLMANPKSTSDLSESGNSTNYELTAKGKAVDNNSVIDPKTQFVNTSALPKQKFENMQRKILIIGNGPSTRLIAEVGFEKLPADMDTFGTTCAFSYFERINWWPTYYGLADRKVAFHHRDKFATLLKSPKVASKRFYLSWKVTESDRLEVIPHSSTGSFCLRKAIELGYQEIYLIGMEGAYVEEITESRALSQDEILELGFGVLNLTPAESKLRIITQTPSNNPNYFYSEYQVAGDIYSLPQAHAHQNNWKKVYEEAMAANVRICNLSPISRINIFDKVNIETIFPFVCKKAINNLFHFPSLGPYQRQAAAHFDETQSIAELFDYSLSGKTMIDVGAHHGSALSPFLNKGWAIFAFEPDEKNRTKLLERLARHKNKALVTLDTRCVSNKSQKGVSFYRSEQSTGISGLSAFHESHVEAQRVDTTTLTEFFRDKPLPEVDFLKIDTEGHDLFVLQGFPWDRTKPAVIECEFEDTKTVPLGYTFHDLAQFLVEKDYTVYVSEWHPIVRYGIQHDWRQLIRYPCELADSSGWGNLLAFREPIDEENLVAAVRKVLKVGTGDGAKPAVPPSAKTSVTAAPTIGTKPAPVFSAQSGRHTFKVKPSTHFKELSTKQWRYTHSNVAQKLWRAIFDIAAPTAGRSFVGSIRLKSNRAMTLVISIGREGSSEYEGANQRITLAPGVAQSVRVSKKFTKSHTALKVQIEVLQLEGGDTADLTIDSVSVNETLASIRSRIPEGDLSLRVANRLYREKDYSTAMGLYLLLHQQHPLKMYPDNALMAARKLGMDSVHTVEELVLLVQ